MKAFEILKLAQLERLSFLDRYRTDEEQSYVWRAISQVKEELLDIEKAIEILKKEEGDERIK